MLSLTVNTSSSLGSMVLGSSTGTTGAIVGEIEWHKEKSHSEKITVLLEELLKKSNKRIQDIELLICGHGPGSFTGLRVGLSVVKTLAFSLNLPIIAVDDCFALAINVLDQAQRLPICVMIDAQKNKVFAGLYEVKHGKLHILEKPALLDFEQLNQQLKMPMNLCVGDGFAAYNEFFSAELKSKLIPKTGLDEPKSKKIFEYVSQHPDDFQKIKWPELSALYLRASAAEEVLADKLSKKK